MHLLQEQEPLLFPFKFSYQQPLELFAYAVKKCLSHISHFIFIVTLSQYASMYASVIILYYYTICQIHDSSREFMSIFRTPEHFPLQSFFLYAAAVYFLNELGCLSLHAKMLYTIYTLNKIFMYFVNSTMNETMKNAYANPKIQFFDLFLFLEFYTIVGFLTCFKSTNYELNLQGISRF